MSNQYENSVNVSNACNYASLASYNADSGLNMPKPKSSGTFVVPSFGGMSHDALSHGSSCNGYASINNAYGNPNKGTEYIRYPCGGSAAHAK